MWWYVFGVAALISFFMGGYTLSKWEVCRNIHYGIPLSWLWVGIFFAAFVIAWR